jgi:hypothetical protein
MFDQQNDALLYARVAELAEKQLEFERSSADSLGSRGTALSGFIGLVLAVTSSLAGQAPKHLGALGQPLFLVLFIAAVGLLVAAAVVAVLVVSPKMRPLLNPAVLRRYSTLRPDMASLNEHYSRKTIELIELEGAVNTARANRLSWAFRLLLGGLGAAAGQAIVIVIVKLGGL